MLIDEYEIRLKNENEDCVGGNKNKDFAIILLSHYIIIVIIIVVKVNAGIVERKLHDLDSKLDENRKNFEVCTRCFFSTTVYNKYNIQLTTHSRTRICFSISLI